MTLNFSSRRTEAVLHQLCMCFLTLTCLPFVVAAQSQEIPISNYNHGYNYDWSQSSTKDSLFFSVWVEAPSNPVSGFIGADLEMELDSALPTGTVVDIQLDGSCLGAPNTMTGSSALENSHLILSKAVRNAGTGVDAGGHVLTITVVCPIGSYPVTNPQVALGGVIMVENVDLKWAGANPTTKLGPKVWPVPATAWAKVAWEGHSQAKITAVDARGQVVFRSIKTVELPFRLPVNRWPPGRYWIALETDKERSTSSLTVTTNP